MSTVTQFYRIEAPTYDIVASMKQPLQGWKKITHKPTIELLSKAIVSAAEKHRHDWFGYHIFKDPDSTKAVQVKRPLSVDFADRASHMLMIMDKAHKEEEE